MSVCVCIYVSLVYVYYYVCIYMLLHNVYTSHSLNKQQNTVLDFPVHYFSLVLQAEGPSAGTKVG